MDSATSPGYRLKISLAHTKPPIWRRVELPGSLTLADLHQVIQVAMGWQNEHLHGFRIGRVQYGPSYDDFGEDVIDEASVRLSEVLKAKVRMRYEYDFGDGWVHDVVIEAVLEPHETPSIPVCIAGQRACPPGRLGRRVGLRGIRRCARRSGRPGRGRARRVDRS